MKEIETYRAADFRRRCLTDPAQLIRDPDFNVRKFFAFHSDRGVPNPDVNGPSGPESLLTAQYSNSNRARQFGINQARSSPGIKDESVRPLPVHAHVDKQQRHIGCSETKFDDTGARLFEVLLREDNAQQNQSDNRSM